MKNKKYLPFLIICLTLLFLISGLFIKYHKLSTSLVSQKVAERWQGNSKTPYTQNSVFFPLDQRAKESEIHSFRNTVDQKLKEASLQENTDNRFWIDAYSAQSKLEVASSNAEVSLSAYGVGGDYFFFHPYTLKDGAYFNETDIQKNLVVLDVNAAWALFGSTDIAGMSITIHDKRFIVCGVVQNREATHTTQPLTTQGKIYLSYREFYSFSSKDINTYEIVLPEPIKGFAYQIISERFNKEEHEIVTNTNRFSFPNTFKNIFNIESMITTTKGVAFISSENEARILEYQLIQIILLAALFLVCLVFNIMYLIKITQYRPKIEIHRKVLYYGKYYFKKYKENLRQKHRSHKEFKS